jgi:hypothetical protein
MRLFLLCLLAAGPLCSADPDPLEIIRRSVENDQIAFERLKDYTCVEHVETKHLDGKGRLKKVESETFDVLLIDGTPYRRLIRKNGQPLSAKDDAKEQKKFDEAVRKRRSESEEDRRKRIREYEKDRKESRAFGRQVPEAFHFRMAGTEQIDGRPVWVIDAVPRAGFKATVKRADMLKKMRGRLWVDQQDYHWAKADAEVVEDLSFGLAFVKVRKGAHLVLEQARKEDLWLPVRIAVTGSARVGYLKNFHIETEIRLSDYKRFQTDTRILSAEEIQ